MLTYERFTPVLAFDNYVFTYLFQIRFKLFFKKIQSNHIFTAVNPQDVLPQLL